VAKKPARRIRKKINLAKQDLKRLERHHVIPVSRGGQLVGSNVIYVQRRYHRSWHHLFSNLTPAEAILHILRQWNVGSIIDELTIASVIRMIGGRICEQEKE